MREQRYSRQRERIYEAVRASKEHPTADMIYQALRPELPKLSLGTVYRNLQQMAQDGLLMEIDGPVARFDAEIRPHSHFRCGSCGRVSDVNLPYDPALDQIAGSVSGWNISGHSLMFSGICPSCEGNR